MSSIQRRRQKAQSRKMTELAAKFAASFSGTRGVLDAFPAVLVDEGTVAMVSRSETLKARVDFVLAPNNDNDVRITW